MQLRRLVPAIATVAVIATACGSSGAGDEGSTAGDGIGGVVDMVAEAPADAAAGSCDIERRTITTAADTYLALIGAPPSSEQDLIDEGLLREASELFDVASDGSVVAAPTGSCV